MTYHATPLKFFGRCLISRTMPSYVYLSLFAVGFCAGYNQFPGDIQCSGAPAPPPMSFLQSVRTPLQCSFLPEEQHSWEE